MTALITRLTVALGDAGVDVQIDVGGQQLLIETVNDTTPTGVPLVFFDSPGVQQQGLACYPQSTFKTATPFQRLFFQAQTATANTNVYVMIVSNLEVQIDLPSGVTYA